MCKYQLYESNKPYVLLRRRVLFLSRSNLYMWFLMRYILTCDLTRYWPSKSSDTFIMISWLTYLLKRKIMHYGIYLVTFNSSRTSAFNNSLLFVLTDWRIISSCSRTSIFRFLILVGTETAVWGSRNMWSCNKPSIRVAQLLFHASKALLKSSLARSMLRNSPLEEYYNIKSICYPWRWPSNSMTEYIICKWLQVPS